MLNYLPLDHL